MFLELLTFFHRLSAQKLEENVKNMGQTRKTFQKKHKNRDKQEKYTKAFNISLNK